MKNNSVVFAVLLLVGTVLFLFGCTQTGQMANGGQIMGNQSSITQNNTIQNNTIDSNAQIAGDKNTQTYNNLSNFTKVKNGDNVKVNYTGRLTDGNIFDTSIGREPLEFTVGAGQMIKGFDSGVVGMKKGETKTLTLTPDQAYGERNPALIKTFDSNVVPNFSSLSKGMKISTSNGMPGLIVAKNDKSVTVDFNPELAGQTLVFEITIVSIN
ncbi:MAG: peptidylprolyl isomerase [Candidatus Diapherotrites archaeon]|nr:peptidylprolyl isomerase [Candidatus Diapherotrites archaeon]